MAEHAALIDSTLLWLALILLGTRLLAPLAVRLAMPAVLGELLLGVVLGNLGLAGWHEFDGIGRDPVIAFLAQLGAIVLLLQIGLETRIKDLVAVGVQAALVGTVGVLAPFALVAFVVGPLLLPGSAQNSYLFLGATLVATSIGISGRVFRDLGALDTRAARIVLGAAVIDDLLGLMLLAALSSLVVAGTVSGPALAWIVAKAVMFFGGSIALGRLVAPYSSRGLARLDSGPSMLFAQVLATGLALAWLAHAAGLAPILGAFAAGLLFEPAVLRDFDRPQIVQEIQSRLTALPHASPAFDAGLQPILLRHTGQQHARLLEPIGYFFVPVFFVLTGMQVKLDALAALSPLALALGLTAAAVAGKLVTGVFARRSGAWLVGWGMVPRGEVGLIFATVGRELGVLNAVALSVVVIVVILTTLMTPPMLTWLLRRAAPHR
jgi:Kef-type K+ transport system membrane component KefB